MNKMTLIDDLRWRGLVHQCTDEEGLVSRLEQGPLTLYAGFDPTAVSLHVGNLIPLLTLARFQRYGHRALVLIGGSTGLIGDPSGKAKERDLQDPRVVRDRAAAISSQIERFVDVATPTRGKRVNNLDWTENVGVLEFLRDIGKHFSVNAMLARDSVKSRLKRDEEGISFTEFAYMTLQAYDFLMLAENERCELQIGGSDQWGNMCSGIDLVGRELGRKSFALTLPLLTTFDGQKFGKSEKGAIWLDAALTSPWDFMQFWKNTDDRDVIRFLKLFTFLQKDVIDELAKSLATEPHLRRAQLALAHAMTDMAHGRDVRVQLDAAADALYGRGDVASLDEHVLASVAQSIGVHRWDAPQAPTVAQLLVFTGLESSNTKAAKVVSQGGASVNQVKSAGPDEMVGRDKLLHNRFIVLKKGKRDVAIVEFPIAA